MNLKNYVIAAITLMSVATLSSCADKVYEGDNVTNINGAIVNVEKVSILATDWKWNAIYDRYEVTIKTDIVNNDVYEFGEVIASLYLQEEQEDGEQYEVVKFLPFSRVFFENVKNDQGVDEKRVYTEQFGFDYQEGYITFYIENSDKAQKSDYLTDFTFKVSAILDEYNIK